MTYPIPRLSKRDDISDDGGLSVSAFVVAPERNCVQLLLGSRYYQWNLQSHQLEREFQVPIIYEAFCAFSRDGKTLVQAGRFATATFSTRTGRTLSYLPKSPNPKPPRISTTAISAYSSYIISNNFGVAQTRTGHVLWQFDPMLISATPVFSPDETLTALRLSEKGRWEIRDTKTGHLIRTLSLMSGVSDGAFSPDNFTFYSVADGIIYRQRVR